VSAGGKSVCEKGICGRVWAHLEAVGVRLERDLVVEQTFSRAGLRTFCTGHGAVLGLSSGFGFSARKRADGITKAGSVLAWWVGNMVDPSGRLDGWELPHPNFVRVGHPGNKRFSSGRLASTFRI
jgi:hypothetical protein